MHRQFHKCCSETLLSFLKAGTPAFIMDHKCLVTCDPTTPPFAFLLKKTWNCIWDIQHPPIQFLHCLYATRNLINTRNQFHLTKCTFQARGVQPLLCHVARRVDTAQVRCTCQSGARCTRLLVMWLSQPTTSKSNWVWESWGSRETPLVYHTYIWIKGFTAVVSPNSEMCSPSRGTYSNRRYLEMVLEIPAPAKIFHAQSGPNEAGNEWGRHDGWLPGHPTYL